MAELSVKTRFRPPPGGTHRSCLHLVDLELTGACAAKNRNTGAAWRSKAVLPETMKGRSRNQR